MRAIRLVSTLPYILALAVKPTAALSCQRMWLPHQLASKSPTTTAIFSSPSTATSNRFLLVSPRAIAIQLVHVSLPTPFRLSSVSKRI